MTTPYEIGDVKKVKAKSDYLAVLIDNGVNEIWVKLYEPYWLKEDRLIPTMRIVLFDCSIEYVEKNNRQTVVLVCYKAEAIEKRMKLT